MSLADRRAAALTALAHQTPPAPAQQRYPGETRPSGDLPEDPWRAAAHLATTRWLQDEGARDQDQGTAHPRLTWRTP
ncbi:hypothetical protein ACIQNG_25535 [Streptomyces sp. NPDC091377]|uniref:hypothetical protein n=1 Tax=Streptomyces sp. NPDC091377 TaxID=3365995 RepID=UPI00382362D5